MFSFVSVSYASDLMPEIKNAAKSFQKDYWNFDCSIEGTPVSLGALSYSLAINEWGYKLGTVWRNTNNWWSLHHSQVKPIKSTVCADWVCTRPVYNSVHDWLYDKLYLITHKKIYNSCKFWYNQLFSYIVWPNAKPNSTYAIDPHWKIITKKQYVNDRLKQLKQQALKYDWPIYNPPLDEWISEETHKKECRYVGNAKKWDYIQLDSRLWVLLEIFWIKNDSKVFICSN